MELLTELKKFLQAHNQINRGAYDGWLESEASPCNWQGVGCDADRLAGGKQGDDRLGRRVRLARTWRPLNQQIAVIEGEQRVDLKKGDPARTVAQPRLADRAAADEDVDHRLLRLEQLVEARWRADVELRRIRRPIRTRARRAAERRRRGQRQPPAPS